VKNRIKSAIILLSVILFSGTTWAYKFDFVTVSDVVTKVRKKFSKVDSYQANFSITSKRGRKVNRQTGVLKYKSPNKLLIEFYSPRDQKIVSDGKMMWIYIPSMNVVAQQDLKSDTGLFGSGTRSGLRRLFSKYHYRFLSKKQPEETPQGTFYTLFLKQKESRSGFKTLKLWINSDYMISKAQGETTTGKTITIDLSKINTQVNHPTGIFRFSVPARARVITNPMIAEE
jgi:outer membrane lipoprotein carrier protein